MKEVWKDVKWYEWSYKVSNKWNVKSLNYRRTKKERILKWNSNWKGYLYISFPDKHIYIHRLVAISFLSNEFNKPEVNHKDWNKWNNNIKNLEWVTKSENEKHKYRVLWIPHNKWMLWKKWALCKNSKKVNQYSLEGIFIKEWVSATVAWDSLNIKNTTIGSCCINNWRNKTAWWYIWKFKLLVSLGKED